MYGYGVWGAYIGADIARFHADQAVIEEMLDDLVGEKPLVNFSASLLHKDGSKFLVMIYSNARMSEGSFLNTRCFTVPVPKTHKADRAVRFVWPRNEKFVLAPPGRDGTVPDPIRLALKCIASRKRLEESL